MNRRQLLKTGVALGVAGVAVPVARYRVAGAAYYYLRDDVGVIRSQTSHGPLHDALVNYVRAHGFQTSA